ncbi:MAG: pentapeptide repeat-containing protein, partial [Ktedonobacterales bacterium]
MLLGNFPYANVHIKTLGEWLWILKRREWPGGFLSTDDQLNQQAGWFNSSQPERPQTAGDGKDILSPLADFRQANFSHTNLDWADLSDADVRHADLSYTHLEHAQLGLALMTSASLERASLISDSRAEELDQYYQAHKSTGRPYAGVTVTSRQELLYIMRERGWEGAPDSSPGSDPQKVVRANLIGVDLTRLDLQCADLLGADLTDAQLIDDTRAAELRAAYKVGERPYNDVAMHNANEVFWIFRERQWSGAPDGVNDRYAGQFADLRGINLKQAKLAGVYLCYAQFESAVVEGARLRGARLIGASASSVRFQAVDLRHADMSVLDGSKCNFEGSALIGAKFDTASL